MDFLEIERALDLIIAQFSSLSTKYDRTWPQLISWLWIVARYGWLGNLEALREKGNGKGQFAVKLLG